MFIKFMRSIRSAHTSRQPRTRSKVVKGKIIQYIEPGVGAKLIAAVLADGSFVVVNVEDGDYYSQASAVPLKKCIGEMHKREPFIGREDVDDGKWFGEFYPPNGGYGKVEDECGRQAFDTPDKCAAEVLRCRTELHQEELRILANPVRNLERELSYHDWYCAFSDAPGVCGAGEAHMRRIRKLMEEVDDKTVRELWSKYAPAEFTCPV